MLVSRATQRPVWYWLTVPAPAWHTPSWRVPKYQSRRLRGGRVLAAACRREERRGGAVLIASGDRDDFQLASPNTTILYPQRGGALIRIGPAEVQARYGVEPAQVPDFIALRGDSSDNIPGAPGVGAKGAAALLKRYGSLERLLADGRLPAYQTSNC